MKKLFLLFLLIMVCLPSFADDEDKKSESLTVAFKDKSGSLIQESRFEVGKVGSIQFDVIIFTEFFEENLGWQFCGLISSALSKDFRQNH